MPRNIFSHALAAVTLSVCIASPALAGDEICVINKTDAVFMAGGVSSEDNSPMGEVAPNDAFCITVAVTLSPDKVGTIGGTPAFPEPLSAAGGIIKVEARTGVMLSIGVTDPVIGALDFDFRCWVDGTTVETECDLPHSDAQKGDDGVYRVFIQ